MCVCVHVHVHVDTCVFVTVCVCVCVMCNILTAKNIVALLLHNEHNYDINKLNSARMKFDLSFMMTYTCFLSMALSLFLSVGMHVCVHVSSLSQSLHLHALMLHVCMSLVCE